MDSREELERKREAIILLHKNGRQKSEIVKLLKKAGVKVTFTVVSRTIKRYLETGSIAVRKKSGRPRSKRTPEMLEQLHARLQANPRQSHTSIAREMNLTYRTVGRALCQDLPHGPWRTRIPAKKICPCANCGIPLSEEAGAFYEFMAVSENDERRVSISEAIETVFEAGLKLSEKHVPPGSIVGMCFQCISLLAELFRFYTEFMETTKHASYIQDLIQDSIVWTNSSGTDQPKTKTPFLSISVYPRLSSVGTNAKALQLEPTENKNEETGGEDEEAGEMESFDDEDYAWMGNGEPQQALEHVSIKEEVGSHQSGSGMNDLGPAPFRELKEHRGRTGAGIAQSMETIAGKVLRKRKLPEEAYTSTRKLKLKLSRAKVKASPAAEEEAAAIIAQIYGSTRTLKLGEQESDRIPRPKKKSKSKAKGPRKKLVTHQRKDSQAAT